MYSLVKRSVDLLGSLILILLLTPVWTIVVIGLLLSGEGYVFYFQERIGYKNQKFKIWKFATMLKDSPNMTGGIITVRNDPRLTPFGGLLRKTKLNELPQLVNVLIGEMSFVGPRPVMQKSFDQYPSNVQDEIYKVKPGITGIGSIVFRDEERMVTSVKEEGGDPWLYYKDVIYPYKGKLEQWYAQNCSLPVDIRILWMTLIVILIPDKQISAREFKQLPEPPVQLNQYL
jgi:lipopolysaccharide/colanic/teichoic acid biosynthesis glycosyltransferase